MQNGNMAGRGNGKSAKDVRILLIDQDQEHTTLLREYLNEAGGTETHFELTAVERLNGGLKALTARPYDVVILALSLPDSQGLDTFCKLRAQSPGMPVIVLTDVRGEATALEALRRGAQDYLVKGTLDARLLKHVIRYSMMEAHVDHAMQRLHSASLEAQRN